MGEFMANSFMHTRAANRLLPTTKVHKFINSRRRRPWPVAKPAKTFLDSGGMADESVTDKWSYTPL